MFVLLRSPTYTFFSQFLDRICSGCQKIHFFIKCSNVTRVGYFANSTPASSWYRDPINLETNSFREGFSGYISPKINPKKKGYSVSFAEMKKE